MRAMVISFGVLCFTTVQAEEPVIIAEAVGLQVFDEIDEEGFSGSILSPFDGFPAVTVTVLLRTPVTDETAPVIVAIDSLASRVTRFWDAAGNDLLIGAKVADRPAPLPGLSSQIGLIPEVSKDGRFALVELNGHRLPASGSAFIRVQASLSVNIASGTAVQTTNRVQLKRGAVVSEPDEITIGEIETPDWGDMAMLIELNMPGKTLRRLARVTFRDDEGKDMVASQLFRIFMMDFAQVQYALEQKVDAASLELIFHEQVQQIQVPVDLEVTLGL